MDLFAKFSLGLMFVLGSLWSGTLGLLGIVPAVPSASVQTSEYASTTTQVDQPTAETLEATTLRKLDNTFATDGTIVYGISSPVLGIDIDPPVKLEEVDAKSFKLRCSLPGLSDFACDATHLVNRYPAVVAGDYDLASLQGLGNSYYRDKHYVYRLYHSNVMGRVEDADPETFVLVYGNALIDARDKDNMYSCGEKYDPSGLERACY